MVGNTKYGFHFLFRVDMVGFALSVVFLDFSLDCRTVDRGKEFSLASLNHLF